MGGETYMRQEKHQRKDKPAVALVLCFCLMALVSIFVVKANIDKVKDNMGVGETADVIKEQAVDEPQKSDAANAEVIDSRENEPAEPDEPEPASDYIVPVTGEIIMEHSVDMPIYWKTLDQYMTHNGIDIASPLGTPVQACADGTVTKIEENDKMGVTVEINHGDNLISVYSNLASDGLIELGEVVVQGTVIGKVGHSAMFEFENPDHLHFEMHQGDEPVDPRNYIK